MSAFPNTVPRRIDQGMFKSEKIYYNRESVSKRLEHITLTKHLFPRLIEIPWYENELLLQIV